MVSPQPQKRWLLQTVLLVFLAALGSCQSADGNTDENRPYEFGFVIEGEQHRYEKKDEKGIIMGEYGFITGDGVYHLTVYQTDENGNFRIVRTKNTHIGLKMLQPTTTTTSKPTVRKLYGLNSCSGCLIPTSTESPANPSGPPKAFGQDNSRTPAAEVNDPIDIRINVLNANGPKSGTQVDSQDRTGSTGGNSNANNFPFSNGKNVVSSNREATGSSGPANQGNAKADIYNQNVRRPGIGEKNTKNYSQGIGSVPSEAGKFGRAPDLLSSGKEPAQSGNTSPIPQGRQGDVGTQAAGKGDLSDTERKIMEFMARLYKFNYTLTFHGHEEEGDVAGNKRGSYFSNGRDGYQRKVVYLANQFGYQPMVTLHKLEADSTPNELDEKERTQLKGNEFIWFYDKTKL